ncbi:MAG: DUF5067 domain-containing protein [Tessaracoccus sp.]|uniref:DUF5067 domain-containing protein n=1 Tax=Tessaracoccus sp. TaxID=1971211 RepID=UPI001EC43912|nr:DUF5067 domain-containing protein [Tessaracoccus sp.]MBK7819740.1 DUF5067 domain-containing protein [Tessaracoccus sp.]
MTQQPEHPLPPAPPSAPPQGPYAPGQQAGPAPRGLAIAAFVVGIAAFLSGLVPVWGIVAGLAAVALGIISLLKGQTKWMTVLAIVLGGLAVVASAFTTFTTAALLNAESPKSPPAASTPQLTAGPETFASTEPSNSPAAEPSPSAAQEAPEMDRKYAVTINDSRIIKDYEGKPALVVDLTFTNNSDDTANFMFATSAKAFQDGVELESMVFTMNDTDYDSKNSMKDIKPGKSIDVQQAFLLDGKDDVELTVTELISFDDTPLASAVISVK